MPSAIHKYAAALLSVTITAVAFLTSASGSMTEATIIQLALLVASSIGIYVAPLLNAKWRAGVKTGIDVVSAVLVLGLPIAVQGGHITGAQLALFVLAGLKALATDLGVSVRLASAATPQNLASTDATTAPAVPAHPVP